MAEDNKRSDSILDSVDLGWLLEALANYGEGSAGWMEEEEAAFGDGSLGERSQAGSPSAAGATAPVKKPYYGRPKERIPLFLEKLGELWQEHWPDWRFGQLMCNLDRYYQATHNGADFFYLEEDAFEAFLEEYAARGRAGW